MDNDKCLLAFKAITNFVEDLNSLYGKNHKPLRLYQRLISKTQIVHDNAIKRHVECFKNFCLKNKEAINNLDVSKLEEKKIMYSDRVYINFEQIFNLASEEDIKNIWKHFLTINALLNSSEESRIVLKNMIDNGNNKNEASFIEDIFSEFQNLDIKDAKNPMDIMSKLMSSGSFTNMMSKLQTGFENGQLNPEALGGILQTMLQKTANNTEDPELKNTVNEISQNIQNPMFLMSKLGDLMSKENKN